MIIRYMGNRILHEKLKISSFYWMENIDVMLRYRYHRGENIDKIPILIFANIAIPSASYEHIFCKCTAVQMGWRTRVAPCCNCTWQTETCRLLHEHKVNVVRSLNEFLYFNSCLQTAHLALKK